MYTAILAEDEAFFRRKWFIITISALIFSTILSWYVPRIGLRIIENITAAIPNWGASEAVYRKILGIPSYLVTNTRVGVLPGLLLGWLQWIVLREHVVWAKPWFQASVGSALSAYLSMIVFNVLIVFFDQDPRVVYWIADAGVLIGLWTAAAQWRVLQKYFPRAVWWLVIGAAVWIAGALAHLLYWERLVNLLTFILRYSFRELGVRGLSPTHLFIASQMIILAVAGLFGSYITSRALIWVTQKHHPSLPTQ